MIEFEWDSHNLRHILEDYPERGNSVEEVESVFFDPDLTSQLGRIIGGEQRYQAFGIGISGIVKSVIYTVTNGKIRPISCWPANKQSIKRYENARREKGY
jgi:uncharacterized protein